ncbi:Exopolysaccharide biosynthesis protein related to N-acetylglucosamine-1-phosphodiester alpha-N-acetylglucosaminidase [Macrococcoides caseolyticum]|uniref:phosphodiester glycosidase family protein n=1 Tax=Macrococcoides caseolyticum TaxID=69966 RepID=UPI000E0400F4|nr:phosphodiester glycosidase family protein [Macrococcus caseolyticus]STY76133.1 Exopolysaccharide biosynthesis protein related to N-acetylglucosamine-1-phosphodiester alpha-N-acetylglucosaminidase [Macrococcus caseolyticus]
MVIRNIYTGRGNRENVNGVNSNFAYLFGEMSNLWGFVNGKGDEILSSEAIQEMISRWIDKNDFKPKEAVATFNDLPKEAELKEIRGVTDENAVYVYDGEKWIKQSRLNFDGLDDVKKNIFYNEIVTRSYRDEVSSTDYWVTVIPYEDEDGEKIEIKKGTTDKIEGETPREFFERTGSSFVVNASIFNSGGLYGIHIKDGEIYKDTPSKYEILGITKDREFKYYPSDTTSDTMLKDNVYNSFTGFASILKNGQELPLESFAKVGSYSETHPRVVVGTNTNKDLYVIVTDGRKSNNIGMTYEDITRISKSLNLMDAYSLDGGGSAQAIHNGNFIGGLIDNDLTTERKVYDFLYVPKKTSREIDSQVNTTAENSVRLKKIENNYIDRRMPVFNKESTFKAKSYFEDYFYVLEGKALYNKSIDDFSRLIGAIGGYNYVGSDKKHLHLEAKSKLTASVEGSSYTVSLIPNNPVWKTPSFTNGWKSDGTIKGKYIKVGDIVTITGYFLGTAGNFTKPIFYIDEGYRPKQVVVFTVPVTGGNKEYNTLTINPSGSVHLAHDISTSNDKSGVQVHVSYTVL